MSDVVVVENDSNNLVVVETETHYVFVGASQGPVGPTGATGDVSGPESSTTGNFASFADASGDVIADSGKAPADFQPVDAGLTSIAGLTTAADKMIYTTASDTYAVTDLTAFARTILDDANAAAVRTTLGLVIGTNVQAYDAGLASIAGLTTAANKLIYTTASDTYAVTDFTAFGRSLVDDADAATGRATLGLVIGTNVQAYDAGLASIAGLTTAANKMIYTTALDTYAVTDLSAFARTILDDADASAARTTLGLVIGTDVQAEVSGATYTDVGTPASTDLILLQDASDSNNLKVAQFSAFGGIGGSSGGTDNALIRADGTGGSTIQGSTSATLDDSGNLTIEDLICNDVMTNYGGGTASFHYLRRSGGFLQGEKTLTEAVATTTGRGTSSGLYTYVVDLKNSNIMLSTYLSGGTGGTVIIDADTLETDDIDATGTITATTGVVPATSQDTLTNLVGDTYTVAFTCGTSGTVTLSSTADLFRYDRVNGRCHVSGQATVDSVSSPTGTLAIDLPFASAALDEVAERVSVMIPVSDSVSLNANDFALVIEGGSSVAYVYLVNGGVWSNVSAGQFKAGTTVILDFSYPV